MASPGEPALCQLYRSLLVREKCLSIITKLRHCFYSRSHVYVEPQLAEVRAIIRCAEWRFMHELGSYAYREEGRRSQGASTRRRSTSRPMTTLFTASKPRLQHMNSTDLSWSS